ncbi:MAG: diguanylate cyclase [Candidatus Omnitrophota bacterium]
MTGRWLIEVSSDPVVITDGNGFIVKNNRRAAELFRFKEAEEMAAISLFDLVAPEHRQGFKEFFDSVLKCESANKGVHVFMGRDGVTFEAEVYIAGFPEKDAGSGIFINVIRKKDSQKPLKAASLSDHKLFLSLFDSIDIPIHICDPEVYEILYLNKAAKDAFASARGGKCYKIFRGIQSPCPFCVNKRVFGEKSDEPYIWETQNPKNKRWYHCVNKSIPWFGDRAARFDMSVDITEQKLAQEKLEKLNKELLKTNRIFKQLALRDSHTGLSNHRRLKESVESEFIRAKKCGHNLSVIMLDIDYFKSINDVYSHEFGDLIIKQLARQLKKLVKKYDIAGRFGGEEFVIICPETDRSDALNLAQRILGHINMYSFGDKIHSVKLKLSLAVASYPEDKIAAGMELINLADRILNKVKEYGGNSAYSSVEFKNTRDRPLSKDKNDIRILRAKIEKLTKEANQGLVESIFAFAKTLQLKDHYTGEHVEKTVHYATEIACALQLPQEELKRIRQAAILHDLGKIGIKESILLKNKRLTDKEFEELKKHPQIGVDIIRPIQSLRKVVPLILYHHERWDGKGYLSGLKREEIPLGARIIAISDVYEALTSDRPYRKAYSKENAVKIIKNSGGTQFDPKIVNAFLKILQEEE